MAVELNEYFNEAVAMFESAESEIQFRNAVSRGYYGVYHMALHFADRKSVIPLAAVAGGTHKKLSDFYGEDLSSDKAHRLKMRKVGIQLRSLHAARCKADYWLDDVFGIEDMKVHFKLCSAVIESVKNL